MATSSHLVLNVRWSTETPGSPPRAPGEFLGPVRLQTPRSACLDGPCFLGRRSPLLGCGAGSPGPLHTKTSGPAAPGTSLVDRRRRSTPGPPDRGGRPQGRRPEDPRVARTSALRPSASYWPACNKPVCRAPSGRSGEDAGHMPAPEDRGTGSEDLAWHVGNRLPVTRQPGEGGLCRQESWLDDGMCRPVNRWCGGARTSGMRRVASSKQTGRSSFLLVLRTALASDLQAEERMYVTAGPPDCASQRHCRDLDTVGAPRPPDCAAMPRP